MKGRMPYPANGELMVLLIVALAWGAMEIFKGWAWLVEKIFG